MTAAVEKDPQPAQPMTMCFAFVLTCWTFVAFAAPVGHHAHADMESIRTVPTQVHNFMRIQTTREVPPGYSRPTRQLPITRTQHREVHGPFLRHNPQRCAHMVLGTHRGRTRVRTLPDYSVLQPRPNIESQRKRIGVVKLSCHGQWGNRLGECVLCTAPPPRYLALFNKLHERVCTFVYSTMHVHMLLY